MRGEFRRAGIVGSRSPIRVSDAEDGASGYEAAGEDEIDN